MIATEAAARGAQSRPPRPPRVKPAKPYEGFPLFPHATGRWAKKINGRFAFFGPWEDPHGAHERFLAQRDALYGQRLGPARPLAHEPTTGARSPALANGRPSSPARHAANVGQRTRPLPTQDLSLEASAPNGLSVRDLVNHFLTAKQRQMASDELGKRAFVDYHGVCGRMIATLTADRAVDTLTTADFSALRAERAKRYGPVALGIEVGRVRTIFKHAYENGLIDRPVRFGPEFVKPSRRVLRLARTAAGPKLFEAAVIKKLLDAAGVHLKAMIMLGINCGMGNTDVSVVPRSALDLDAGWLNFPRPKTGIARRAALWPETIAALKASLKARPKALSRQDEPLVFVTRHGRRWVREQDPGARSKGKRPAVLIDAISVEFSKLCTGLKSKNHPRRLGFYTLRHTFRTIADEVGDRRAIDLVMGHENGNDISTHYVERISDERLRKVAEHVRLWLGMD